MTIQSWVKAGNVSTFLCNFYMGKWITNVSVRQKILLWLCLHCRQTIWGGSCFLSRMKSTTDEKRCCVSGFHHCHMTESGLDACPRCLTRVSSLSLKQGDIHLNTCNQEVVCWNSLFIERWITVFNISSSSAYEWVCAGAEGRGRIWFSNLWVCWRRVGVERGRLSHGPSPALPPHIEYPVAGPKSGNSFSPFWMECL